MQQESRNPQIRSQVEPALLSAPPSYPLLAAKATPKLLAAPPNVLLLAPPRMMAPAPEIPLSDLITILTQRLLRNGPTDLGVQLKACTVQLNQRLSNRAGTRTYYAYPTEALERIQKQLASQGRSAANQDEAQAWRNLSMAFASAIHQRGEGA